MTFTRKDVDKAALDRLNRKQRPGVIQKLRQVAQKKRT